MNTLGLKIPRRVKIAAWSMVGIVSAIVFCVGFVVGWYVVG